MVQFLELKLKLELELWNREVSFELLPEAGSWRGGGGDDSDFDFDRVISWCNPRSCVFEPIKFVLPMATLACLEKADAVAQKLLSKRLEQSGDERA